MSYEKREETINAVATDVVRFYYVTDDVFNAVSEATSFKAASVIKEKDGQADFDRIQISADEKNFMKKYLREAMLEIFATMFKIIAGETVVHDTGSTIGDAIDGGFFVIGTTYQITSSGVTDFTAVGAADSVVGTIFVATAAGTDETASGGGTATEYVIASYADVVDNEKYRVINLALIDQLISNAINDFIIFKWYALKGLGNDAEIHMSLFKNGLVRIVEKTLALRQPK